MTIVHHPSDLTLADWAAGTLDVARALVVSSHLARCPHCRAAVRMFESVGGALLEDAPPAEIAPDALDRALAHLGVPEALPIGPPRTDAETISGYALGPWRWLGRGRHPMASGRPAVHRWGAGLYAQCATRNTAAGASPYRHRVDLRLSGRVSA
jgi:putative transcriptional regulator